MSKAFHDWKGGTEWEGWNLKDGMEWNGKGGTDGKGREGRDGKET